MSCQDENCYSNVMERLMVRYRSNPVDIDAQLVEDIVSSKNISQVKWVARGPNSSIFVGRYGRSGNQLIAIKAIPTDSVEQCGGFMLKRNLPHQQIEKDSRILHIYGIECKNNKLLLILSDYFPRQSLAKLLIDHQGPLGENISKSIFKETLQALCYLHSHKIAHRNLKLENILIDDEHPVIGDYTHTVIVNTEDKFDQLMATSLPYLAPEILAKMPYDPLIADVWSFGVCLFITLHNRLPSNFDEKSNRVIESIKLDIESNLSDQLKDVISHALQCDVNKRATSNELLTEF